MEFSMRWWISGCTITAATFFSVTAFAQPVMYGAPRDVYGNLLVVPDYEPYADPPPARYRAPRNRRALAPIDPMTGYPVGSLPSEDSRAPYSTYRAGPQRAPDPIYARQIVTYRGKEKPGTIIIDTPSKFLYLVQEDGTALRYGIGVGRPGFEWAGRKTVTAKREWPDWRPPAEMRKRRPDLPVHMAGGPDNPLGARALYLGSTLYRIHGTNEPNTIGQAVSSGCIRMLNEDVEDLYERVPVGAQVLVI
jgi:lipoprotein-anchoring transpeptidase ErfK/SrfK